MSSDTARLRTELRAALEGDYAFDGYARVPKDERVNGLDEEAGDDGGDT